MPFTRRTSATRHDNNKHRGQAEIVRLLEYIVGRGTGRYVCSKSLSYGDHQKWQVHNSNRGFGLATVADSAGARFISGNGPQEPQRGNMYKPPHYSATPMMGPAYSDDQLRAQEIGLKIKELKRLVIKYQEYLPNADGIINWAIHCSSKSDTKFLDEKLAQLHTMEASRSFQ